MAVKGVSQQRVISRELDSRNLEEKGFTEYKKDASGRIVYAVNPKTQERIYSTTIEEDGARRNVPVALARDETLVSYGGDYYRAKSKDVPRDAKIQKVGEEIRIFKNEKSPKVSSDYGGAITTETGAQVGVSTGVANLFKNEKFKQEFEKPQPQVIAWTSEEKIFGKYKNLSETEVRTNLKKKGYSEDYINTFIESRARGEGGSFDMFKQGARATNKLSGQKEFGKIGYPFAVIGGTALRLGEVAKPTSEQFTYDNPLTAEVEKRNFSSAKMSKEAGFFGNLKTALNAGKAESKQELFYRAEPELFQSIPEESGDIANIIIAESLINAFARPVRPATFEATEAPRKVSGDTEFKKLGYQTTEGGLKAVSTTKEPVRFTQQGKVFNPLTGKKEAITLNIERTIDIAELGSVTKGSKVKSVSIVQTSDVVQIPTYSTKTGTWTGAPEILKPAKSYYGVAGFNLGKTGTKTLGLTEVPDEVKIVRNEAGTGFIGNELIVKANKPDLKVNRINKGNIGGFVLYEARASGDFPNLKFNFVLDKKPLGYGFSTPERGVFTRSLTGASQTKYSSVEAKGAGSFAVKENEMVSLLEKYAGKSKQNVFSIDAQGIRPEGGVKVDYRLDVSSTKFKSKEVGSFAPKEYNPFSKTESFEWLKEKPAKVISEKPYRQPKKSGTILKSPVQSFETKYSPPQLETTFTGEAGGQLAPVDIFGIDRAFPPESGFGFKNLGGVFGGQVSRSFGGQALGNKFNYGFGSATPQGLKFSTAQQSGQTQFNSFKQGLKQGSFQAKETRTTSPTLPSFPQFSGGFDFGAPPVLVVPKFKGTIKSKRGGTSKGLFESEVKFNLFKLVK